MKHFLTCPHSRITSYLHKQQIGKDLKRGQLRTLDSESAMLFDSKAEAETFAKEKQIDFQAEPGFVLIAKDEDGQLHVLKSLTSGTEKWSAEPLDVGAGGDVAAAMVDAGMLASPRNCRTYLAVGVGSQFHRVGMTNGSCLDWSKAYCLAC